MAYQVRQGNVENDKTALLSFWREHGAKPLDKKFSWMYEGNPYGEAVFWLLIDEKNQEIVGSSALFPREIVINGKIFRAAIAGDLLIHKNHRTMGPALVLMRTVFEKARDAGFDMVYTLPNKSADLLAKRVGYTEIGHLGRYVNLLKVKRQLIKRGVHKTLLNIISPIFDAILVIRRLKIWWVAKPAILFKELNVFDERFIVLWMEYYSYFSILPDRSIDYMNWKYFNDPDDENKVYAAFSSDKKKMLGCVIYSLDGESLEIRELLSSRKSGSQKYIVATFIRYLQKMGVESLLMNAICNKPCSEMLLDHGFALRSKGRNIRYACFNNKLEKAILTDKDKWYFVMSDEDT